MSKQEIHRLDNQKDKYSIGLSLNSVVASFLTAESFYPSPVIFWCLEVRVSDGGRFPKVINATHTM
jgi:hypothetical protein